jgi:phospholipase/carboxylesterase
MNRRIQFLEELNQPEAPTVILFHGFGADMNDLFGLKDLLTPVGHELNWICPNGPYSVPVGPGWTGSAWWPLKLSELPGDWSNYSPETLPEVLPQIQKMIQQLGKPWNKIILGGFSQGAMLATELYLSAPETPLGLLSFSGSLISKNQWKEKIKNRTGEKIFLSHGEQDPVLPSKGTQQLIELMKLNQLQTDFVSFRGGHEIPAQVCERAKKYLEFCLEKK